MNLTLEYGKAVRHLLALMLDLNLLDFFSVSLIVAATKEFSLPTIVTYMWMAFQELTILCLD